MEENNNLDKENTGGYKDGKDWWKPVMFFYVKTTSWIVLPLVFGVIAGGYVGRSVGSQLVFFLFLMSGFAITCYGIYREIKEYKKILNVPTIKDMKNRLEEIEK